MINNNQDIEQLLKENLAQRNIAPDPQLWHRVQEGKRAPEPSPWRSLPVEIMGGLIGISLVLGVLLWFSHDQRLIKSEKQNHQTTIVAEEQPAVAVVDEQQPAAQESQSCPKEKPTKSVSAVSAAQSQCQLQPAVIPTAQSAAATVSDADPQPSSATTTTAALPDVKNTKSHQPVASAPKVGATAPTPAPEPIHLFFPNVITPNGDGINDFFVVKGADGIDDFQLQIFNARQHRVYSNSNYKGDFSGADLPAGTYFFVARIASRDYTHKGTLVIMK